MSSLSSTPSPARIGLYSTLTSSGSRELVLRILDACASGEIPGVAPAFLLVEREAGEFEATDASVNAIAARHPELEIIRASAIRFGAAERKAARAAGDEAALWRWRDAFYASYRERLPATDLDLLLGSMWIWGRRQCAERRGVNLHPSLPSGPLGKMWFEVIWDLVVLDEAESGVMLHRVTPEVDEGPVVSWCRYPLHDPELDALRATIPTCFEDKMTVIHLQRALKREATHPLFHAIRSRGYARELPLMLATIRAVGEGRLRLEAGGVYAADGEEIIGGLDLTAEVEASVEAALESG
jgi:folate-dependent phosphoribosylglycinamide formyltransferase PurN